jgi:hypothetical protein
MQTDINFRLAYNYLALANEDLGQSDLIGAAEKPLNLGYLYHIYFRTAAGLIIRAETLVQLYTLKVQVRSVVF